ncbi:hypothetical protein V491_04413, partial [Pseudogymnoascus sp. VKM F-3775]
MSISSVSISHGLKTPSIADSSRVSAGHYNPSTSYGPATPSIPDSFRVSAGHYSPSTSYGPATPSIPDSVRVSAGHNHSDGVSVPESSDGYKSKGERVYT